MRVIRAQWDRFLGIAAVVAGAVVLLLGYLGISGTSYPAEQLPYLVSGGLVGVLLIAGGGTLWLSADLRDEWLVLSDIRQELQRLEPEPPPSGEAAPAPRRRAARA
jgi:peptidoglycan/LPS O-acetylase OafA/YrhL